MKQRWGGTPPEFGYKDIIPEFKAEKWDQDAWAELFQDVGAKYVVLTAEHHDGWANWNYSAGRFGDKSIRMVF